MRLDTMLHTGEGEFIDVYADGERVFAGGNINQSGWSNGIGYVGFVPIKIGWDSENIRHFFQNRVTCDGLSWNPQNGFRYPWIDRTNRRDRFFFQFGGIGGF